MSQNEDKKYEAIERLVFEEHETVGDEARREFMKRCGKYAAFVAPAVTSLLLMEGASNPGLAESG